ncbi:putative S-layer protein, partial [Candidatus Pacearchaeota archaeon]|nr:putative S-layer protein [Candidatus Pacearchaeota archaeon]
YLNVQGDCFKTSPATVTASLQSGGKAGEDLVVNATVKNTGTESATYIVNAAGYSTWAESANVNPGTFTLAAGESKDVLVTLVVSDGASGENTFNVEVVSGNELAVNQPVTVNIEGKSGFLTGSFLGSSGGYTGVLALVTLILVVAIIIVLVKLFRK